MCTRRWAGSPPAATDVSGALKELDSGKVQNSVWALEIEPRVSWTIGHALEDLAVLHLGSEGSVRAQPGRGKWEGPPMQVGFAVRRCRAGDRLTGVISEKGP